MVPVVGSSVAVSSGVAVSVAGSSVAGASGWAATANANVPSIGCPSDETTRHATVYVSPPSATAGSSAKVAVLPSIVGAPCVTTVPAESETTTCGSTGSGSVLNVSVIAAGGAASCAPSAGSEVRSRSCADAGPAVSVVTVAVRPSVRAAAARRASRADSGRRRERVMRFFRPRRGRWPHGGARGPGRRRVGLVGCRVRTRRGGAAVLPTDRAPAAVRASGPGATATRRRRAPGARARRHGGRGPSRGPGAGARRAGSPT